MSLQRRFKGLHKRRPSRNFRQEVPFLGCRDGKGPATVVQFCGTSSSWNMQKGFPNYSFISMYEKDGMVWWGRFCVLWSEIMKRFVGHEKSLEEHALPHRQPMKVMKNGMNMVMFLCTNDKARGWILHTLEFGDISIR